MANANSFSLGQITAARYGRETVTYTWGPATLATGETTVYALGPWNIEGEARKVVTLEALAATQNAAVQLLWQFDSARSNPGQGYTDAMPAGLRPMRVYAPASTYASLTINNTSGAAIDSFQLNYTVTVARDSAAQNQMAGLGISQSDSDLLGLIPPANGLDGLSQVMTGLKTGTLPISWDRFIDTLLAGRELPPPQTVAPMHMIVSASGAAPTQTVPVPGGAVAVLWGLSVEGAPSDVVTVTRDNDSDYVAVNGGAFVQANEEPFRFFVPAKRQFVLSASGTANTVPVRADIRLYSLSDLLALHFEMSSAPAAMRAKVRAGLR